MMYSLYELLGGDTATLVSTLKRLMTSWPAEATDARQLIEAR
jgi:hypothetical protein